jgi:hypothetical protein
MDLIDPELVAIEGRLADRQPRTDAPIAPDFPGAPA